MEPWSSRHLQTPGGRQRRGSRGATTMMAPPGEMSDATRRKNSQEVSRLEVAVRHMDREMAVKAGELTHEQMVLQRSLTAHPSPARRRSLSSSAANFESLKRREKDNLQQLIDGKCKNFIIGGGAGEVRGLRLSRDDDRDDSEATRNGDERRWQKGDQRHQIPTAGRHHSNNDAESNGRSSESPSTDGEATTPGGDISSNNHGAGPTQGGQYQHGSSPRRPTQTLGRQRRYGVARATDVHLDIDLATDQDQGNGSKNGTYTPLRRTSMHHQKFRRTSGAALSSSSGGLNGSFSNLHHGGQQQHQQQHPKTAIGHRSTPGGGHSSRRDNLDLTLPQTARGGGSIMHRDAPPDGTASSTSGASSTTPDDGAAPSGVDDTHGSTSISSGNTTTPPISVQRGRKKSLPVVMGRQMRRHDRSSSKSRESLLLPNLGQGRSPSPMSDLRVKVTYNGGGDGSITGSSEEFTSVSDVPFKPHLVRGLHRGGNALADSSIGGRGPRLEIDLSIPMAGPMSTSNPSTPRPSGRSSKREKTYTV